MICTFQACGPCVPLTVDVIQDHIVVSSSRVLALRTWLEVLNERILIFILWGGGGEGGVQQCLLYNGVLVTSWLPPQRVNGSPNGIAIYTETIDSQSSVVYFSK